MAGPIRSFGFDILNPGEEAELAIAWKSFLKAVSTDDMKKLKGLSAGKIRCLLCVDNTEEKDREMTRSMKTDPDWYEKLYKEEVFIPVDRFCREDYPIIFKRDFKKKLQTRKPSYGSEDSNGKKIYEVIITTTNPGELGPKHEGGQHFFQFIKTDNGYKFWGIDTIP
jgi:hypothetical protein